MAKLQDQLNWAKAELAGMENAVRDNQEAIDGLGREVEDAGEAMDEAGRSAVSFGDILKANIIQRRDAAGCYECGCQFRSCGAFRCGPGGAGGGMGPGPGAVPRPLPGGAV